MQQDFRIQSNHENKKCKLELQIGQIKVILVFSIVCQGATYDSFCQIVSHIIKGLAFKHSGNFYSLETDTRSCNTNSE